LNNTVFGRNLIAVGTNKSAANFSGVKVNFTTIVSYCISSVVAVISAIMVSGYIGFADGDIATGYEFDVLLVAVLGGNALGGGRSSVTGILGGAFVVTVLLSIVIIFGLDVNYQYIIKGSILLLAAIINTIVSKK
jgi:ribose/xylose/arabinose/galactoside ABC-type transport system permease subunit